MLSENIQKAVVMAVDRQGFKINPAFFDEAIASGLVVEADPTWMYSDDHRVSNGFALTQEGRAVVSSWGWLCKCLKCVALANPRGSTMGYCSGCYGSGRQYGLIESSCGMHWLMVHKDVAEERRQRKDSKWLPDGTATSVLK